MSAADVPRTCFKSIPSGSFLDSYSESELIDYLGEPEFHNCEAITMLPFFFIVTIVFLIGGAAAQPLRGAKSFIPAAIVLVFTIACYLCGLRFFVLMRVLASS